MITLLKKEINQFFNTVIGYFVVCMFLLINGLILWLFSTRYNILDNGYASLETYFAFAPWVFVIFVPAITMRMFSEEIRMGTLELLITKPLTEMQIILAKYFASVIVVLASLIPTLIYFYSVFILGYPAGNIDTGGTWGSFIGLFFLASVYTAIGIFTSSLTTNQIVAMILSAILCLVFYLGFDALASLPVFSSKESLVASFGINEHYKSISRGVLDSRDIIYFAGVTSIFLFFTRTVLQSRKW